MQRHKNKHRVSPAHAQPHMRNLPQRRHQKPCRATIKVRCQAGHQSHEPWYLSPPGAPGKKHVAFHFDTLYQDIGPEIPLKA